MGQSIKYLLQNNKDLNSSAEPHKIPGMMQHLCNHSPKEESGGYPGLHAAERTCCQGNMVFPRMALEAVLWSLYAHVHMCTNTEKYAYECAFIKKKTRLGVLVHAYNPTLGRLGWMTECSRLLEYIANQRVKRSVWTGRWLGA